MLSRIFFGRVLLGISIGLVVDSVYFNVPSGHKIIWMRFEGFDVRSICEYVFKEALEGDQ